MQRPALVADIGGTNARFALVDLAAPGPALHAVRTLPTAGFDSLEAAAGHYIDAAGVRPREASVAVASPVTDEDPLPLTNSPWSVSRTALRRALALDRLLLLNDFGAVAHAVPALVPHDRIELMGPARDHLAGPVSVLGPGTGLGVALLVETGADGWTVVETEGGHVGFAPQCEEEARIADALAASHGRVSTERLLCGSGLAAIEAVLRHGDAAPGRLRSPAQIVDSALAGADPIDRRALARFCEVLGSVAGDLALAHGARTLMIAGGIVPRFVPYLQASGFARRFLDKGRFAEYLARVAVHVVIHPHPGLLGAALALRHVDAEPARIPARHRGPSA